MEPPITSVQNGWIKSLKRLHHASERHEQKRFLIEGPHLVEEAIATQWPLEAICYSLEWGYANQRHLSRLAKTSNKILLQPVAERVLKQLSTTDSACSVIAIASLIDPYSTSLDKLTLAVAVESLQDPGNLGALIRIAAASGASPVILGPDCVDATNPKVLRSTAGQWFRSPPIVADLVAMIRLQRALGVQVLAAAADGDSFWEADFQGPTLFVLGNEGAGLSLELRSECSGVISIPMAKGVESLNVSIAGALLLFEAKRQRNILARNVASSSI